MQTNSGLKNSDWTGRIPDGGNRGEGDAKTREKREITSCSHNNARKASTPQLCLAWFLSATPNLLHSCLDILFSAV